MSAPLRGRLDGSQARVNASNSREVARYGGPEGGAQWAAPMILSVPMIATEGAGVSASVANPFGREVLIVDVYVEINTVDATETVDVGVAANGTTSSDTLLDGLVLDNAGVFATSGTNGLPKRTWGASQFVTATTTAGSDTFAGWLHLNIIDPAS